MLVINKRTPANNFGDTHHHYVAGPLHALGHRQLAVAPFVMAVDIPVPYMQRPVADEGFVSRDLSGVQSGSHRKRL